MTTPHQPSLGLSINSESSSSFLKQLLDEINGTGPPTTSYNSKPLRTNSRVTLNRDIECAPSGGVVAAQDAHERVRTTDETCLKLTNTFPEVHHGSDGIALPRPRPNLGKLKTQLPAPSQDEVAQSSSALTCSESGVSSTSSHSGAPSSALTTSSMNATIALSRLGSRNNSPHKREQDLNDTDFQHVSKKMRSIPSPDVQDLLITAYGGPHFTMDFQHLSDSGNVSHGKESSESKVACSFMSMPNERRHRESLCPAYSVAIDDPPSAKAPRPTAPQGEPGWQRTSTTPDQSETPETPSFARSFHLFDTSVSMFEDGRGNKLMQDISIYKSTHGDDWARNSLCQHCFRRRGLFSRIMAYGYESCGREKCLDDYYWEPTIGSGC